MSIQGNEYTFATKYIHKATVVDTISNRAWFFIYLFFFGLPPNNRSKITDMNFWSRTNLLSQTHAHARACRRTRTKQMGLKQSLAKYNINKLVREGCN